MKRLLRFAAALVAAPTLVFGVAAQAAGADSAQVTKATLPSGFTDANGVFYPATCDETQVIADGQRTESFNCTFDAAAPAPQRCAANPACFWFSDFDGAMAVRAEFVITPSGLMVGSAKY